MKKFDFEEYKKQISIFGKKYIKTVLTKAKKITVDVLMEYRGKLETKEGEVILKLDDYLAFDGKNYWVISAVSVANNKEIIISKELETGWVYLKSKTAIDALEMNDNFETITQGGEKLIGKNGDYLVFNGFSFWPCGKVEFERDYKLILNFQ